MATSWGPTKSEAGAKTLQLTYAARSPAVGVGCAVCVRDSNAKISKLDAWISFAAPQEQLLQTGDALGYAHAVAVVDCQDQLQEHAPRLTLLHMEVAENRTSASAPG